MSESQFAEVLEKEVTAFKRVCYSSSFSCYFLQLICVISESSFFCSENTCRRLCMTFLFSSQACRDIQPDYNPGITFIVAQKRHNTRFFPQGRECIKNGNVIPGNVVCIPFISDIPDFNKLLHCAPKCSVLH